MSDRSCFLLCVVTSAWTGDYNLMAVAIWREESCTLALGEIYRVMSIASAMSGRYVPQRHTMHSPTCEMEVNMC